jgi:uncharacterized protein YjbI with pentapeptide repeats
MYKIYTNAIGRTAVMKIEEENVTSFSFDPANTDYANFKKEVLAGAELQDADGNVMTQEQADEFIATLP